MFSTRLAEALEQNVVAGLQEQHDAGYALVADRLQEVGEQIETRSGVARIDHHGDVLERAVRVAGQRLRQRRQQLHGKVVDAVVAEVLERMHCGALAGSGEPADDDELHRPKAARVVRAVSCRRT